MNFQKFQNIYKTEIKISLVKSVHEKFESYGLLSKRISPKYKVPVLKPFKLLCVVFCLFFSCFYLTNAQESKEILELKEKLVNTNSDEKRAKIFDELGDKYGSLNVLDSAIHYNKQVLPFYIKQNNNEKVGRMYL